MFCFPSSLCAWFQCTCTATVLCFLFLCVNTVGVEGKRVRVWVVGKRGVSHGARGKGWNVCVGPFLFLPGSCAYAPDTTFFFSLFLSFFLWNICLLPTHNTHYFYVPLLEGEEGGTRVCQEERRRERVKIRNMERSQSNTKEKSDKEKKNKKN